MRTIVPLALGAAALIGFLGWSWRRTSELFPLGLLAGAGLVHIGLHQLRSPRVDVVQAITFYPVESPAAKLAVVAVAIVVLIGFLLWTKGATSNSFFLGALAGTGFVLSFDIVFVHWIFGLHHVTNTDMDIVLEPLLVLAGLVFLWFAITRELASRPVV